MEVVNLLLAPVPLTAPEIELVVLTGIPNVAIDVRRKEEEQGERKND